jgi:UTP:GlnB (protein PII) uridylyltransferase
MEILRQPAGITHALRLMNQTSVLGRYLLNFRRIVGQMQHDLYHVYTVDQHILMVLRNLRRFAVAEHAHEYPFCSQLIANFDRPWVLYVARCFTTSPKAAAATIPRSAWPTRGASAATMASRRGRRTGRLAGSAASDHEPGRAESRTRATRKSSSGLPNWSATSAGSRRSTC